MAESQETPTTHEGTEPLRVLLMDNDEDVAELVQAVLGDEGYAVTALNATDHDSIASAVGRMEPDCILLDGAEGPTFGGSWVEAAYLATRDRAIPVVMFTAHAHAIAEAREGTSDRAVAANFAAVLAKPFSIDELLDAVATAAGRSQPFDRTESGERERTMALRRALEDLHATDIRTSDRREWATFALPTDPDGIYQLYWWQQLGVYIIGRYGADARLERIGQAYERSAAIQAAMDAASAAESAA